MAIRRRQGSDADVRPLSILLPGEHVRLRNDWSAQNDNRVPNELTVTPRSRWTINGDFVTLQPAGVARYAREVTQALDALFAEGHPLTRGVALDLVAPGEPREPLQLQAIPLRIVPEFRYPRLPQVWVQTQLPRHVEGGLLSFCNLAPVTCRKHIACIHDLHTRIAPESYGRLFRWAHRVILPMLGRRAELITTVSELSREHLVRFGIATAEKIVVTGNGCDHVERWRPDLSQLQLKPGRPFIVFLGRKQKYKNLELVLEISRPLDEMGIDIYMAGDLDAATLRAYTREKPQNLRLLGRISDDDFARALSHALCLILPSRIEGFGLPAIEAMKIGCPVIASSAPALPEVCGDAALLVDPDDGPGWVSAIYDVRTNLQLRRALVDTGYSRARSYSWRRIGELYLKLMARIDGVDLEMPGKPANGRRKQAEPAQRLNPVSPVAQPRHAFKSERA